MGPSNLDPLHSWTPFQPLSFFLSTHVQVIPESVILHLAPPLLALLVAHLFLLVVTSSFSLPHLGKYGSTVSGPDVSWCAVVFPYAPSWQLFQEHA